MFHLYRAASDHICPLQNEKNTFFSDFMPIYTQKRAKTGLEPTFWGR